MVCAGTWTVCWRRQGVVVFDIDGEKWTLDLRAGHQEEPWLAEGKPEWSVLAPVLYPGAAGAAGARAWWCLT